MPGAPVLDVRPYGASALLVEVEDHHAALDLVRWVRSGALECVDAVPAARTVLLDGVPEAARAVERLRAWTPGAGGAGETTRTVTLPVHYDGADLERVAELWQVQPDQVVRRHTSTEFVSAFCGFAPGFAYLAGLPEEWAVPRLDSPRTRVPLGSVALADRWCGVYPTPSPGGWLLIGHTDVAVWDLTRADESGGPALLAPGTRVRFEVA